jgi:hypothetical protein
VNGEGNGIALPERHDFYPALHARTLDVLKQRRRLGLPRVVRSRPFGD